ncbi:MAG: sodium:alanine symporter family protein [Tissierellia bacterium]|nr:sodium:alanine symporter family protein [Tissierellia bacterium]
MNEIMKIVEGINGILWNYILLILLIGVGVYLTIRLKFPQFSRVLPALKGMLSDIKNKKQCEKGTMTPFQSLATAIAAQVGTGNIVGVATAIASGGPGAAFWMILSAFFGMSTIFGEAVLAQIYREVKHGKLVGGPAYYIKNGLKSKFLSTFFAIVCIMAMGIIGIMVQSNSVVNSLHESFHLNMTVISVILIVLVGAILSGGMNRIGAFTEKVVPFMALLYIVGALIIVISHITALPTAIKMIFIGAFEPKAISGGVLGIGLKETIRFGLARGLFSNEAGMGSTPHSHAVAKTNHPAEQGFIAMIGVFIATFIICLSTVMINLTSGSYDYSISAAEMTKDATLMTQIGFSTTFGKFGGGFLSIALTFFSLTTIVGWYFFALSNVKLLCGKKRIISKSFKFIVLIFLGLGPIVEPDLIWLLADMFMGLMALPNIIAIIFLSNKIIYVLKDYDQCVKNGDIKWTYEYQKKE